MSVTFMDFVEAINAQTISLGVAVGGLGSLIGFFIIF